MRTAGWRRLVAWTWPRDRDRRTDRHKRDAFAQHTHHQGRIAQASEGGRLPTLPEDCSSRRSADVVMAAAITFVHFAGDDEAAKAEGAESVARTLATTDKPPALGDRHDEGRGRIIFGRGESARWTRI